jgi:hypothetical protein
MPRFQRSVHPVADPGAMPQAITFRALGASETRLWRFGNDLGLLFPVVPRFLFVFAFFLLPRSAFRSEVWKQNHVADGLLIGE